MLEPRGPRRVHADSTLKVALVYESFTLGDSLGRQRVFLARALVRQGVEVHF
jgi:hypothetical protein